MAHTIEIPIAFEWRPQPASWKLAMAEATGWVLGSHQNEPHFEAQVEQSGARYMLQVPWWAFPKETLRLLQQEKAARFGRSYWAELLICSPETRRSNKLEDPWSMREEFLRLKTDTRRRRDTKALLAFLNKCGMWGPTRICHPAPAKVKIPPAGPIRLALAPVVFDSKKLPATVQGFVTGKADRANSALSYLFPFDIWKFQKDCRDALTRSAGEWLPTQKLLALATRPQFPHYVLNSATCQRAVLDSIVIDLLRKVRFRLCARHDCRAPFAIETQHQRKFCSLACAHLMSVRRQRRKTEKKTLIG